MKASDKRPKAQDVMLGHITGYWISRLVFVAAKVGLADALAKGPQTVTAAPRWAAAAACWSQRQGVHGLGLRAAADGQIRMAHERRARLLAGA